MVRTRDGGNSTVTAVPCPLFKSVVPKLKAKNRRQREARSEPDGCRTKSIGGVDHKEHRAKSHTVPDRCLDVHGKRFLDMSIVERRKLGLSAKRLCGANGGDDLFSQVPGISHMIQR